MGCGSIGTIGTLIIATLSKPKPPERAVVGGGPTPPDDGRAEREKTMIRLTLKRDGATLHELVAKEGTSLDEVLSVAEWEVYLGCADYSAVEVDGEIYAEYEL